MTATRCCFDMRCASVRSFRNDDIYRSVSRCLYFIEDGLSRHSRASGNPAVLRSPGFRLALAIASLAGMTPELFNGLRKHRTIFSLLFPQPGAAPARGAEPLP